MVRIKVASHLATLNHSADDLGILKRQQTLVLGLRRRSVWCNKLKCALDVLGHGDRGHTGKLTIGIGNKFKPLCRTVNKQDCITRPALCRHGLIYGIVKVDDHRGRIVDDQFRVPDTDIDFPTAIGASARLMRIGRKCDDRSEGRQPEAETDIDDRGRSGCAAGADVDSLADARGRGAGTCTGC